MIALHTALHSQMISAGSTIEKLSALFQLTFHSRCRAIIRDNGKYILKEKYLPWLDLAGKSVAVGNWKRFLKTRFLRILPPTLHEFLMEESQLPASNGIGCIFWEALNVCRVSFYHMEVDEAGFRKELFELFRKKLLSDVQNSVITGDEYIRRFMSLPDVHRDCSFEKLNEFLTRHSTEEPLRSCIIYAYCKINRKPDCMIEHILQFTSDGLENLLCRAKEDKFDFWGLWKGIGELSEQCNPVLEFMMKCRSCKVLLKYGFPYAAPRSLYVKKCLQLTYYRINEQNTLDFTMYCKLINKSNWTRMLLILETFTTFELNASSDNVSNLRLVSRIVPDPYVTPSEMFSELEHIIHRRPGDDFMVICERYAAEGIYDEDYTVYKPRLLLHLSRCVVRKILADNFNLPEGIEELDIPRELKPYLALKY